MQIQIPRSSDTAKQESPGTAISSIIGCPKTVFALF